jgi:hypothetical protein
VAVSPASDPIDADGTANRTRRMLLAGMLSGYAAALIPWALAQPVADANRGAFPAVSAILAGRRALDQAQAKRLYDALAAGDPGFPAAASALLALIEARNVDPLQLQEVLDAEHSVLAPLPRRIVTAWYLGVVGEGERARMVAFETAAADLRAIAVGIDTNNLVMVMLDGVRREAGTSEVPMPGFAALSDRQLATLGAYVTQRYGNPGATVTEEQVRTLRAGGAPSHLVLIARLALAAAVIALVVACLGVVRRRRRPRRP